MVSKIPELSLKMEEVFRRLAIRVSRFVGSLRAIIFFLAVLLISGAYYNFSGAWESNISFLMSAATLMVLFFLQKSQNHNDKATHLKLDELIRASEGARNEVSSVENQADYDIEKLKEVEFEENR